MDWMGRFLLNRAPDAAYRLAQPPEPIPLPPAPQPVIQQELIEVDLYQKFLERMDKGIPLHKIKKHLYDGKAKLLIKPNFYNHFHFDIYPNQEIFIHLLSIMLGCDTAHDFAKTGDELNKIIVKLKNRTKKQNREEGLWWIYDKDIVKENKTAINKYVVKANVESVMFACNKTRLYSSIGDSNNYHLLAHCIVIINIEIFLSCNVNLLPYPLVEDPKKFCEEGLTVFFKNDANAKTVSQTIMHILGIDKYPVSGVLATDQLQSTPNIHSRLVRDIPFSADNPIKVRIDATSASLNVAPEGVGLSLNPEFQNLIVDIAASADPSWYGVLHGWYRAYSRQPDYIYRPTRIRAFVTVGLQRLYIADATLTPDLPAPEKGKIPIRINVHSFLLREINQLAHPAENSKGFRMLRIIDEWITTYKDQGTTLDLESEASFKSYITKNTCIKTFGDFLQIVTYAHDSYPKAFHTFDTIAAHIASVVGKTVIFDSGPSSGPRRELRFVYIDNKTAVNMNLSAITARIACEITREAVVRNTPLSYLFTPFGKINNISQRLKFMSHLELKNKLKSVGIKITKNVRGKRKYLSRKELENKALLFNKLQNTAKRIKIKIMYKSRNGLYKYKTYIRLQKEINSKYQKPVVKNFNFG